MLSNARLQPKISQTTSATHASISVSNKTATSLLQKDKKSKDLTKPPQHQLASTSTQSTSSITVNASSTASNNAQFKSRNPGIGQSMSHGSSKVLSQEG